MATMNTLKKAVVDALEPRLRERGFSLRKSKTWFVRRRGDATDKFQLVCLDAKPGLRLQPNVGMRIESVENIFHRTSRWEPEYQKDTPTLGAPIGALRGGTNSSCDILVEELADVPRAVVELERLFREVALPYYERFSDLCEIDRVLNDEPNARTPHRGMNWLRCATGLIVARLVGRPNYDELVAVYRKTLETTDKGFYVSRFEDLVDSLRDMRPSSSSEAR